MSVTISGSGQVPIQVVSTTNTTQVVTTSGTFVTTGQTVTITPSNASNKVFVSFNTNYANDTSNTGVQFAIYRGGTKIWPTTSVTNYAGAYFYSNWRNSGVFQVLDSPATTSAVTYTLYFECYGGQASAINDSSQASAIAMEISGA